MSSLSLHLASSAASLIVEFAACVYLLSSAFEVDKLSSNSVNCVSILLAE